MNHFINSIEAEIKFLETEVDTICSIIETSSVQEVKDTAFNQMLVLRSQIAGLYTAMRVAKTKN